MIEQLIEKALATKQSFRPNEPQIQLPATSLEHGIPTLKQDTYHEMSPMLATRYRMFGRWQRATHGHWLGLEDMATLWSDKIEDQVLLRVSSARIAAEQNWPNEASALFRPERLSLFAGSDNGNEKIYLLWLDFIDEPELWVYDSNGETRYKDLGEYLTAYVTNDMSAVGRSWRA